MNIFTAIGQFFTNWGAKLASTFLEDDRYMMLVEGLGKQPVVVGDINGFIMNSSSNSHHTL